MSSFRPGIMARADRLTVAGHVLAAREPIPFRPRPRVDPRLAYGRVIIAPNLPVQRNLPLASTHFGNLFHDRYDPNLRWYLPEFRLVDDPDPGFAFRASQTGQDENTRPFHTASVTLSVRKTMPADAAQCAAADPHLTVREIPLEGLAASLTSSYLDQGGVERQRMFRAGEILDQGDGSFRLVFNQAILGNSVIGLFQDLRQFGKASVSLSATYRAWTDDSDPPLSARKNRLLAISEGNSHVFMKRIRPAPSPAGGGLVETGQVWATTIPLNLKYGGDGYQLQFEVAVPDRDSRVIVDVRDLSEFGQTQSEFVELKVLGDLAERYPSLSRAYIGTLSRTIVVIPRRYAISRGRRGCSALCLALVDSTPAGAQRCRFEFDFTVAPDVSRIDLEKLKREVNARPDLQDYRIALPDFLRTTPASTLLTTFQSSVQFAEGAEPNTFAISVTIRDDATGLPAVAGANLFLAQLSTPAGAGMIGSLSLRLDDGYAEPVLAPVALGFTHTAGSDELSAQIDAVTGQLVLANQSPLELQLIRYAVAEEGSFAEFSSGAGLTAGAQLNLTLPPGFGQPVILTEAELAVPVPLPKARVAEFINLRTVDVQSTQYLVAIEGSGLNFQRVESVAVDFVFAAMPGKVPRTLRLSRNVRSDTTHVIIPLENAVFSLPGTARVQLRFADPAEPDFEFTLQHDFSETPVLVLTQEEIDRQRGAR